MVLADLWKELGEKRSREIADLKNQVQELQKQNQAKRNLVQEDLKIQAQETRQVLSDFITNLQKQGNEDRNKRQQEQKQRQQEINNLQQEISESIKDFSQNRQNYRVDLSTKANMLSEELKSFHENLQFSVWGIKTSLNSDDKFSNLDNNQAEAKVEDKPQDKTSPELEVGQEILYQFIKQENGVSLIDIEKKLGIQRKSTIELIRNLIQTGMLEQRDRLYFVCK